MVRLSSAGIQSFPSSSHRLVNRCSLSSVTLCVWLAVSLVPRASSAEPVTITSGWVTSGVVNVYGTGFALPYSDFIEDQDFGSGLEIRSVSPFASSYPLGARLFFDVDAASMLIDYQTVTGHPRVRFDVSILAGVAAPVFVLDQSALNISMRSEATGPFTLTGHLLAFSEQTGQQLFERELRGQGTVRTGFDFFRDGLSPRPWAVFTFGPASPVPEPATLMLLSSGLVGLFRRRRLVETSVA